MTTARTGLAAALGRSASGKVMALAEMSAGDILASVSDETKTEIAASLSPAAAAAEDTSAKDMPKKDGCSEDGDEDDQGGDSDPMEKESKASDDRVKAVAAVVETDPACQGKAALALSMLADDDFAGLSASGLVKLLGKTPLDGASASNAADPDAAARDEMKAALAATGNSNIDAAASAGNGTSSKADAGLIWDRAHALNNPQHAR